ncbi:acyltransferase [Rhodococcus rhodochrous]|nr:acyltransferase [Rhodococcus rhodochrous]
MSADDRHMSQTDLMSWRMEEDPVLRSTIVAVALLDRSPDHERFVRMMERGTRAVPSFRRKLVESPFGRTPPRWVDDPDFDLSWHLRRIALPHPGGLGAVLPLVRAAAMSAFDKDRPLWEATIVDGLDLPVLVELLVEGFGDVLAVGDEGTRIETTLSATATSHP